jgi:hypothetical protein
MFQLICRTFAEMQAENIWKSPYFFNNPGIILVILIFQFYSQFLKRVCDYFLRKNTSCS